MISEKNKDKVSLICHATVASMFASFCNPKFRGPNFTWEKFPQMMEGMCATQVFMANIKGDRQEVEDHAKKTGFEIAKGLVKEAGFIDN